MGGLQRGGQQGEEEEQGGGLAGPGARRLLLPGYLDHLACVCCLLLGFGKGIEIHKVRDD